MNDLAVMTSGLTKRYRGDVLAVDHVDLRVARGEIYAFLGLNGAGKSTTIRMLLGMIRPTAGHAELFGQRVHSGVTALWRRVGHLVESATAYPELTVRENLEVARRRSPPPGVGWSIDRVYTAFPLLAPLDRRRAGHLSGGEQQMLAVGRALMGNPRLLILDEPSEGLAPLVVETLAEQIAALKAGGMTLLMAEQNLPLALALADHVCILDKGHVRFAGTAEAFEADASLRREYLTV
jgi:branched-chain amino acid transport system ATP-binding protein